jgi:hypothetical protein
MQNPSFVSKEKYASFGGIVLVFRCEFQNMGGKLSSSAPADFIQNGWQI